MGLRPRGTCKDPALPSRNAGLTRTCCLVTCLEHNIESQAMGMQQSTKQDCKMALEKKQWPVQSYGYTAQYGRTSSAACTVLRSFITSSRCLAGTSLPHLRPAEGFVVPLCLLGNQVVCPHGADGIHLTKMRFTGQDPRIGWTVRRRDGDTPVLQCELLRLRAESGLHGSHGLV